MFGIIASNRLRIEPAEIIEAVSETTAYTWFGRPNYASSSMVNKYWVGTVQDTVSGATQHVVEYDIDNETYTSHQVGTVFEKDDHGQTALLIRSSDRRLMAFYCNHNDSTLRLKVSINPLDASSWSTETSLGNGSVSYISPYQASNGNIFIFYRNNIAGDWRWEYRKSTNNGVTFGSAIIINYNAGVRTYLITSQDGDKIHFVGTNSHPQADLPLSTNIYHFYFDISTETAHASTGTSITLPVTPSTATPVYTATGNDTSWNLDITSKNGNPRILYVKYPNGKINDFLNKDLYFIEFNGTSWVNDTFIARTLSGYMEDDLIINEYAYPPASRFDILNPNIIWMPKKVNGILEIHKVYTDNFIPSQKTFSSSVDNWRPISVINKTNNVLWLKKTNYDYYLDDYTMELLTMTDFKESYAVPNAVSTLSQVVSNLNYVILTLTPPAETDLKIDHYEVYVDGVLNNKVFTFPFRAINLLPETTYSIYVITVDILGQKSSIGNSVSVTTSSYDAYETEYQNLLIYALTNSIEVPSVTKQIQDNQKMIYLKSESIFSELDWLFVCNTEVSEFAKLCWKNPSGFRLTQPTDSLHPLFVLNSGFKKTAAGRYFKTGFTPTTGAVKGTATDVSVFFGLFDFPTTYAGPGNTIYGGRSGNNNSQSLITNGANGAIIQRLYTTSTSLLNLTFTQSNINAHYHISRLGTSSTGTKSYINGVLTSTTFANAGALNTVEQYVLAYNENGVATSQGSGGIKYIGYGSNLQTKQSQLYQIMNGTYIP